VLLGSLSIGPLLFVIGCHSSTQPPPVNVPPTPTSVTRAEPGGDSPSPEIAAFHRLLDEPWGFREDKKQATLVAIPDWQNWKRVKYSLITPYVGFRYGDAHHAMAGIFLRPSRDEKPSSEDCIREFDDWALGTATSMGVEVINPQSSTIEWNKTRIAVHTLEASVQWGFGVKRFAGTYAAYPAWPSTCAILGYAVPMNEDPELARQVRDRFTKDAFVKFKVRTPTAPTP
jgi:hypothetical protein